MPSLLLLLLLAGPAPTRATFHIQPLGRVSKDLLEGLELALQQSLKLQVVRRAPIPLPKRAWYAPRKRWRADRLLDFLAPQVPPGEKILGVTSKDISTTKGKYKDWGIFGLGELGGAAAVVSSFRLKRSARDRDHLIKRLATTAVHEAGHVLGLPHCPEPGCLMQDAQGSIKNTDSSEGLGVGCQRALKHLAPLKP